MAEQKTTKEVCLTPEQKFLVDTVRGAIREELRHECFFSPQTRQTLHDFADAVEEVDASRGTHIIILKAGRAWEDVTERLARFFFWGVFVFVAVVLSVFSGRAVLKFLAKQ